MSTQTEQQTWVPYRDTGAVIESTAWLRANIATTTDADTLAKYLKLQIPCFDLGNSRAGAVRDAVVHFYGKSNHWTPTIKAAIEILRAHYGRLWNYCGD